MYGPEVWIVILTEGNKVQRWEKKNNEKNILWRMEYDWIRWNNELQQLHVDSGILSKIKMTRIRHAGHLQTITEEGMPKRIFQDRTGGRKPRKECLDSIREDIGRLGVHGSF